MANPNHISIQTDGDLIRPDNNNDNSNFRGSKTSLASNKSWRGSKSNHFDARAFNKETSALLPPAITYDEVATAPSSPTAPASAPPSTTTSEPHQMSLSDLRLSASTHQLSKSTSVTPTGSLLCVHNTIQLRESTLTVNYPDSGVGDCSNQNKNSTVQENDNNKHPNCIETSFDIDKKGPGDTELLSANVDCSDVYIVGNGERVRWRKSPSPSPPSRAKSVLSFEAQDTRLTAEESAKYPGVHRPIPPGQALPSLPESAPNNKATKKKRKGSNPQWKKSTDFEAPVPKSSDASVRSSTVSLSSFYTETDSTLGASTDLPELLPSSSESSVFDHYSSEEYYSTDSYSNSDTPTETDASEIDCSKLSRLKHKDSVSLLSKSPQHKVKHAGSDAVIGDTKNTKAPEKKRAVKVSILSPTHSEVTPARVEGSSPIGRRYRVNRQESTPSLTPPVSPGPTTGTNQLTGPARVSRYWRPKREHNGTLNTDEALDDEIALLSGKSLTSSEAVTSLVSFSTSSTLFDDIYTNRNNSCSQVDNKKSESLFKTDITQREIAPSPPRSRSFVDPSAIKEVKGTSPVIDRRVQTSVSGQLNRRDTSQFYFLCNISEDEDDELDNEETPRAVVDADECPTAAECVGTVFHTVDVLDEREARSLGSTIVVHDQRSISNLGTGDIMIEVPKSFELSKVHGEMNVQMELQSDVKEPTGEERNVLRSEPMELTPDFDWKEHAGREPELFGNELVEFKADPDGKEQTEEEPCVPLEVKPDPDLLKNVRSSVQELEELIESDLESDVDLGSNIYDLGPGEGHSPPTFDPDLFEGHDLVSSDEEIWQVEKDVSGLDENDSVDTFSSTIDSVKEKFLCLVQHQTSMAQDDQGIGESEVSAKERKCDENTNTKTRASVNYITTLNYVDNDVDSEPGCDAKTVLQEGKSVQCGIVEEIPPVSQGILDDNADHELSFPYEDDGEVSLLYSRHEKIPMKDFAAEIRASLDVENFLNSAILLLNLDEASIDAILDRMLRPLIVDNDEPVTMAEAKRAIFTHDSDGITQFHKLAKTIQGTCCTYSGAFDYDQSWLCILCTMPALQRRHVAIARLRTPANLGRTSQEVYFIILVVAPTKEKGTKNALETGRTFATLFADIDLRQQLLCVNSHDEFKKLLWEHTKELAEEQSHPERKLSGGDQAMIDEDKTRCWFARGLRQDFKRRLPHYVSDFKDGFVGPHTIHKTLATTIFLYFACLLPSIAFGMLNDTNTKGKMDVKKVIYSQTMGGLIFAFVGGQPLVVLLTTAPLALYTKVIYNICDDWGLDFFAMYACVGLWNMMFLLLYAVSDASRLMKWSTRSTEEIFALFISIAFIVDAFRDVYHNFAENYNSKACSDTNHQPASSTLLNGSAAQVLATTVSSIANDTNSSAVGAAAGVAEVCLRENSLLYLLLCLGTLWLGISLFNFTKTPYLNASKREILADYALPFAVIIMSFFGSYVFRGVKLQPFNFYDGAVFNLPPLGRLPWGGVLGAMALGFPLSLLFFMDQNISSAMVNSPANKLKKGSAYHWDMMIIAILNGVLSFYGLPMVHGALPHSPLHVRALADVEDYVEQGHVYQKIVRVRETRVTAVTAHILIGLSLLMLPNPLSYIPRAVLDGLFLYLAINALNHNQMFDRILLLATEQAAYPPNHYIRSVPQRKVHMFTGAQILQLAVMCGFGFSPYPYLKMTFPVIILLLLPIRHKVVPRVIEKKYLEYLDG